MSVPSVVLDACVLAPPSLCDLLLRLAETPAVYRPVWSDGVLEEVGRTQVSKLRRRFTPAQARHWRNEVTRAFPEAMVEVSPEMMEGLGNHPKDRHVLAAAIRSGAQEIVTFNLRDFPAAALGPWGVRVVGPDEFIIGIHRRCPGAVEERIRVMSQGWTRSRTLTALARHVPRLVSRLGNGGPGE